MIHCHPKNTTLDYLCPCENFLFLLKKKNIYIYKAS